MHTRVALIAGLAICAVSCQRSPESVILGEWTQRRIDAVDHITILTDHVTYRADHTYSGKFEDPRHGVSQRSGIWRIDGHQMICRDNENRESTAEILSLTRDRFQVRPSDGVIADYHR
jgi:hypothetical protein